MPAGPTSASTGRERYRGPAYQMPGPPRIGSMGGPGPVGPMGRGGIMGRSPESAGNETAEGKKSLQRTEFVILFVWKEPTPSDALVAPPEEAAGDNSSDSGSTPAGSGATGSAIPEAPPPPRGGLKPSAGSK